MRGGRTHTLTALVAIVVVVSVPSPSPSPPSHCELFKVRDYSSLSLILSSPEFNHHP